MNQSTLAKKPFVLRYRRTNGFCVESLNPEFPLSLRYLRANGNSSAETEART
jgi:hypothetical protein